ncbi:archease [candidate division WOR-3 bacterium]|nr:archease [candidate division WOR-3 bacterium]
MNDAGWEALEHTSDLKLLIRGQSEENLFENAARALLSQIVELESVQVNERRLVKVCCANREERFLDWLRELLYISLVQGFLVQRVIDVRLYEKDEECCLDAVLCGEMIDYDRHRLLHEVKTVTYQDYQYGKKGDTWQASVVFDV